MGLTGVEVVRIRCFRELHAYWQRGMQFDVLEVRELVDRIAREYSLYTGRSIEDASAVGAELEEVIVDLNAFLKEHQLTLTDLAADRSGRVRYVREWHGVLPPLVLTFR